MGIRFQFDTKVKITSHSVHKMHSNGKMSFIKIDDILARIHRTHTILISSECMFAIFAHFTLATCVTICTHSTLLHRSLTLLVILIFKQRITEFKRMHPVRSNLAIFLSMLASMAFPLVFKCANFDYVRNNCAIIYHLDHNYIFICT